MDNVVLARNVSTMDPHFMVKCSKPPTDVPWRVKRSCHEVEGKLAPVHPSFPSGHIQYWDTQVSSDPVPHPQFQGEVQGRYLS